MRTSANSVCAAVVSVLRSCGAVRHAVLSPGTRNVPLLVAFDADPHIDCKVVVDERSAAFVALGMADATGSPVAIACTSGTAPLNYAPALAEAYYRQIPIFAVTADRPSEWVDQDDSQTIRQPGIFANYVKATYDLPVDASPRYVKRMLHDAASMALAAPRGPVHINVQIADPGGDMADCVADDILPVHQSDVTLPVSECSADDLARHIASGQKILVVAGFSDEHLDGAVERLLTHGNVAVLAEPCAGIHACDAVHNIEPALAALRRTPDAVPDVVVTVGGSIVSGVLKQWLRALPDIELYCVKTTPAAIDCYGQRYRHVQAFAAEFLSRVCDRAGQPVADAGYGRLWRDASKAAAARLSGYCSTAEWSALGAMNLIHAALPAGVNLQLSNGMAVRYAEMFDFAACRRICCNRGVSGIDGSSSTAIGFASASQAPTVFISGDMSFQYDIGALAITFIPDNFRMIVLNNGGGGIFKYIKATRDIAAGPRWYDAPVNLPLRALASAYGFGYFRADAAEGFMATFDKFMSAPGAAILEIVTDAATDAEILRNFLKQ